MRRIMFVLAVALLSAGCLTTDQVKPRPNRRGGVEGGARVRELSAMVR